MAELETRYKLALFSIIKNDKVLPRMIEQVGRKNLDLAKIDQMAYRLMRTLVNETDSLEWKKLERTLEAAQEAVEGK